MKIIFSIVYAGLTLPVMKNEQGQDVTPLKPISDLFGLQWRDQRKKLTESAYLARHLGVCFAEKEGAKPAIEGDIPPKNSAHLPELLIRIDRVAAFLLSINPEKVRAAGNVDGAEFLEAKNTEWADALHDYEEIGVAVNTNHFKHQDQARKNRMYLAQLVGIRNKTSDNADRQMVGVLIGHAAKELGIPYQAELPTA